MGWGEMPFLSLWENGVATLWHVGAAMGRPLMCEHSQSSFHISSHQLEIVRVTRRKACLPFFSLCFGVEWMGRKWGSGAGLYLCCTKWCAGWCLLSCLYSPFLVPLLCAGCARVRIPYKKARRRKIFMLAHFSPIYVVRNPAAEHIFADPPIAISLHTFPLGLRAAMLPGKAPLLR